MGLQPGKTYSISVDSNQIERALPGEKLVTIASPTKDDPNSDILDLRFSAIEKQKSVSISGVAFFEGEERVEKHKSLYKEIPLLSVSLFEVGNSVPLKVLSQLPVSHLFEFNGLSRSAEYEIVVKSSRTMVDRRHETSATVRVEDFGNFLKVIVPLRTGSLTK